MPLPICRQNEIWVNQKRGGKSHALTCNYQYTTVAHHSITAVYRTIDSQFALSTKNGCAQAAAGNATAQPLSTYGRICYHHLIMWMWSQSCAKKFNAWPFPYRFYIRPYMRLMVIFALLGRAIWSVWPYVKAIGRKPCFNLWVKKCIRWYKDNRIRYN
jgi:hypothetical protein